MGGVNAGYSFFRVVSRMREFILKMMLSFSMDFGVNVDHIQVEIVDEPRISHARCEYYQSKLTGKAFEPTMVFNRNHWETIGFYHRRELVYHELGHCALFLRHNYGESIMRPRDYATKLDGSNWNELLELMKKQYKQQMR